jgi:hypothetical protein
VQGKAPRLPRSLTFAARQDNGTSGQEESASENEGKHGERCTATVDEQSKTASDSL